MSLFSVDDALSWRKNFGAALDTIPAAIPYLTAPSAGAAQQRERRRDYGSGLTRLRPRLRSVQIASDGQNETLSFDAS
jgi:hypothetical protein